MLFPSFEQWLLKRQLEDFYDEPFFRLPEAEKRRLYDAARLAKMPYKGEWGDEAALPADEWLIDGLLPQDASVLLHGSRGAGKSFVAVDMAYSGASGLPFMGREVPEPFGAAYFIGEKRARFSKRPRAWQKARGFEGKRVGVRVVQGVPNLLDPKSVDETIAFLNEEVRPLIEALKVPLRAAYIDTLARSVGGMSVSDQSVAARSMDALSRIVEGAAVSVVALAHVAKSKAGPGQEASVKGAGEWEDAADTVIRLERKGLSSTRTLAVTKQSDGPEGATAAFELPSVEVGRDTRGRLLTSCVVSQVAAPTKSPRGKSTHTDAAAVLTCIRTMIEGGHGALIPDKAAPAGSVVPVQALREEMIRSGYRAALKPAAADAKGVRTWLESTRRTLDRALKNLLICEQIGRRDDLVWTV